jgi:hypothetical protein
MIGERSRIENGITRSLLGRRKVFDAADGVFGKQQAKLSAGVGARGDG